MGNRQGGGLRRRARARRVAMFVLALLLVCACWELYKTVGPDAGGKILGARLLPKAENRAMPHVWDMARRFGRPELRGSSRTVGQADAVGGGCRSFTSVNHSM